MDMGGMCMNRWKVSSGKTSDRFNYWVNFFPIHIQPFTNDSNSINNNS